MADDLSEQDIFDSTELPDEEVKTLTGEKPDSEQPRDEQGRFAAKAEKTEEPQAPQPPQEEQPPQDQQPAQQGSKPEPAQAPPGVIEERRRRQEAEQREQARLAELEAMRRELAEVRGFLRGQQRPQEEPKPAEPTDWFVDPDGRLNQSFQKFTAETISPLQKQLMETNEYWSRKNAERDYGPDTVSAAYQWVQTQVNAGDQAAYAVLQRSLQSRDPYGLIVSEYQQRQAIKEVGTDPNAWFEKTLEQKLADPTFQQKIAQKLGPAPTGRAAPLVSIPSINRASGSAATPHDSVPGTEEELFEAAPRRMGRRD